MQIRHVCNNTKGSLQKITLPYGTLLRKQTQQLYSKGPQEICKINISNTKSGEKAS